MDLLRICDTHSSERPYRTFPVRSVSIDLPNKETRND